MHATACPLGNLSSEAALGQLLYSVPPRLHFRPVIVLSPAGTCEQGAGIGGKRRGFQREGPETVLAAWSASFLKLFAKLTQVSRQIPPGLVPCHLAPSRYQPGAGHTLSRDPTRTFSSLITYVCFPPENCGASVNTRQKTWLDFDFYNLQWLLRFLEERLQHRPTRPLTTQEMSFGGGAAVCFLSMGVLYCQCILFGGFVSSSPPLPRAVRACWNCT